MAETLPCMINVVQRFNYNQSFVPGVYLPVPLGYVYV